MKRFFLLALIVVIAYGIYQMVTTAVSPASQNNKLGSSTVTIRTTLYQVEIADNDNSRAQGLSGRKSLGTNTGMLFIFQAKDRYAFWMKDMLFPLDFVWIDGNKIVDLTENVPPPLTATYLPQYVPKFPVDKVLEINAGDIQKHGFTVGDNVNFSLFKSNVN